MKKYLAFIILTIASVGCNKDDDNRNNNPHLPNYNFSADLDLTLPQYDGLNYPGNAVYVNREGVGITDVIVMKTGSSYSAFDATCPNQPITECSFMTIEGINAVCPCDEAEYSLFNGLAPGKQYPMKPYRVTILSPSLIRVSN